MVLSKTCGRKFIIIDFHLHSKTSILTKIVDFFTKINIWSNASWSELSKMSKLEQCAWSSKEIKKWELWNTSTEPKSGLITSSVQVRLPRTDGKFERSICVRRGLLGPGKFAWPTVGLWRYLVVVGKTRSSVSSRKFRAKNNYHIESRLLFQIKKKQLKRWKFKFDVWPKKWLKWKIQLNLKLNAFIDW